MNIVGFCFQGSLGPNQTTKFTNVGGKTGKHFVLVAGKLVSRGEGKKLKEESTLFSCNKPPTWQKQSLVLELLCSAGNDAKVSFCEFQGFIA